MREKLWRKCGACEVMWCDDQNRCWSCGRFVVATQKNIGPPLINNGMTWRPPTPDEVETPTEWAIRLQYGL